MEETARCFFVLHENECDRCGHVQFPDWSLSERGRVKWRCMCTYKWSPALHSHLSFPSNFKYTLLILNITLFHTSSNNKSTSYPPLNNLFNRFNIKPTNLQNAIQRCRCSRRHGLRCFRQQVSWLLRDCHSKVTNVIERIYSSVTETVTACSCTEGVAASTGYAAPSGTAAPTGTGVGTAPTATGSPIYANGGSVKGASAIGMIVAGGVALVSCLANSNMTMVANVSLSSFSLWTLPQPLSFTASSTALPV
jgi:hypothetical protein